MIYFVEDDENIRELVIYTLNSISLDAVGFSRPSHFWKAMEREMPRLILLDIMLPEEDGIQILKKLRASAKTAKIPVMMLTAKGSEYDKVEGLDAGADDYISKPFGMTELISRVKALLRRSNMESGSKTYSIGKLFVDPKKHIIKTGEKEVNLSYKEYLLLITLLEAGGNVVSRNTLLSKVWGEYYEESRTLDVHIRKLRMKLEDAGALIKTVKNIGYKIEVI